MEADQACLRELDTQAVAYKHVPLAGGMRTPIEIGGPIDGITLVARGRRSAVMDCVLARALVQAGGVFKELGITTLAFSAAFDHRTRRGSNEASAHAYGLAIDVDPFQNPYRSGQRVLPELATAYLDRGRHLPGMITADSPVVAAFRAVGWTWGGGWSSPTDLMHFSSTGH